MAGGEVVVANGVDVLKMGNSRRVVEGGGVVQGAEAVR